MCLKLIPQQLNIDNAGSIALADVKVKTGDYLKAPKVKINKNNTITVDCEAEAQKRFAEWKNTFTKEYKEKTNYYPEPVPNRNTGDMVKKKMDYPLGGKPLKYISEDYSLYASLFIRQNRCINTATDYLQLKV